VAHPRAVSHRGAGRRHNHGDQGAEEAGLDIITDGEIRRELLQSPATALEGIDLDNPGTALGRTGRPNLVPSHRRPRSGAGAVEVDDEVPARAHTAKPIKMTVPGPFTMSQQAQNDYYPTEEAAAMAYAVAVNEEMGDLFAASADIVQIDEPYMQAQPEKARGYGIGALNRALEGITGSTAVHICFGYAAIVHQRPSGYSFLPELVGCSCRQVSVETAQSKLDCAVLATLGGKQIMVGCLDLNDMTVETPQAVVVRIRRHNSTSGQRDVILAPDYG
jgi:5-methyltetrahydropteroyltriglutamate--homocysteine methyltransferase